MGKGTVALTGYVGTCNAPSPDGRFKSHLLYFHSSSLLMCLRMQWETGPITHVGHSDDAPGFRKAQPVQRDRVQTEPAFSL